MRYTISDFRRDMRQGAYAWPGGYPCYFVCSDGEPLSFKAARDNLRLILEAIKSGGERDNGFCVVRDDWQIVGCEINWEDTELYCAHTNERIESAYGED